MTAPTAPIVPSDLMSPTAKGIIQSNRRDVAFSGQPRYLPLELPVDRDYSEQFNVTDGYSPEDGGLQAAVKTGGSYRPWTELFELAIAANDSAVLTVKQAATARLYAAALRNNNPVGEWRLGTASETGKPSDVPGVSTLHYGSRATILATGPVTFIVPRERALTWIEVGAGPGGSQKEMVISLRATERGPWQDGVSYKQGDLVEFGGKIFLAIADLDGSPGTGPNLDASDPNTNSILTDVFPPGSTIKDGAPTLDGAEANPAAAAAAGGE
jgi:hypothetical protein